MSDCRFGVSPVNYPDPDPGPSFIYFAIRRVPNIAMDFRHAI